MVEGYVKSGQHLPVGAWHQSVLGCKPPSLYVVLFWSALLQHRDVLHGEGGQAIVQADMARCRWGCAPTCGVVSHNIPSRRSIPL